MSHILNRVSVPVKQGDTNRLTFTIKQSDGSPLDLTGAGAEFSVARDYGSDESWGWHSSDDSGHVEVTDAANGVVKVTLLPEDSRAWGNLLTLVWELTIEFSPEDRLTVSEGSFSVTREVRNANP